MDESQQELYQSCLMYPAIDGRQASSDEQAFIDRMEAKHPEQCRRIGQKLIGNMQAARQRALRSKARIANENKRLAAAERAADYASAQQEAARHKAARQRATTWSDDFADFVKRANEREAQPAGAAKLPQDIHRMFAAAILQFATESLAKKAAADRAEQLHQAAQAVRADHAAAAERPATEQAAKPDVVMAGGGGGTVEQASEPDRVFVVGDCVIVGRNVRATGEHAGIVVAVSDDGVVCQYLDASENVDQYNEPPMRLLVRCVTPVEDLGVELELIGNTYGFTGAGESIATHRNGAPRVWSEPWSVRRIGRHGLLKLARQRLQAKEEAKAKLGSVAQ